MPGVSPCFRDARALFAGPATCPIPRRHVFKQARAPRQYAPHPDKTAEAESWSQNALFPWQQASSPAGAVVRHPAGLFAAGALLGVLVIAIFKRVWRSLGLQKVLAMVMSHSNDGGSNPLRAIVQKWSPRKTKNQTDRVWPGLLASEHEPQSLASYDKQAAQEQETTDPASSRHGGGEDASHGTHLAEMSSVVKQASQKVAALEQLVSVLKSQVKLAERRAGDAEDKAASLANTVAKRDANAVKVQQLMQQVSAAEASLQEKTEALASANNEIRSLQQARQLLLSDEKQAAERLQQADAAHDSDTGSLRADVQAMQQQLDLSAASISAAQAREQELLQDVQSAHEAQRATEKTLLEEAERKMQLETALSEAEAQTSTLQTSLKNARDALSAAEAQRDAFESQVEALKAEVSAAAASIEERNASIASLQAQVQTVQAQLREEQSAVGRLKDRVAGDADLAEQLRQLRTGMAQLQESRQSALREAAAATAQLKQVQEEVSEAVGLIADRAASEDSTAGDAGSGSGGVAAVAAAVATLPPALCGLPDIELQARAQQQQQRLQELSAHASEIEERLAPEVQEQLKRLRSQLAEAKATEEQAELRVATKALLADHLPAQELQVYQELQQELQECKRTAVVLESALGLTLQERISGVLSQFALRTKQAMLEDVAAAGAAAEARAEEQKAAAMASAQAKRTELEAWKQEQEAAITAKAEAQQLELAAIQQQQKQLEEKAAEQAQLQAQLQALEAKHGEAEARAAAVQELQQQLAAQQAQVGAEGAKAQAIAEEAAAEAARSADARSRAQAAQQSAEARQASLAEREAEVAAKEQRATAALQGVNKQLDDARALADRQIQALRDSAATEATALKQQLQAVRTETAQESAAAQAALQERVTSLERELFTLKDRYSRQFIDYKQRLDESEGRVRRLRRELAESDAGRVGGAAAPAAAATPPAPAPLQGGSSVEDVSSWASQLVTKLSEEADASAGGAVEGGMVATDTAAPDMERTRTWPPGGSAGAATAVVAEPEARPVAKPDAKPDALRMQASGHCIPHPAKVERGGEDAHFILGSYAIGVADGVGGWSKNGVDPGEYSRELMRQTAQALRRDSRRSMSCVEALTVAHDAVDIPGTSTAIVARLQDQEHLEVANLGDSGLRVIRNGEIVFATESLQHGFNMPFQLGCKDIIPHTDVPDSALRTVLPVKAGDVVVMASDGFFDNVWDKDLARLVKNSCLFDGYEEENCVEHMAEKLAEVAALNSKDTSIRTPWSVACAKYKDVGLFKKLFPKGGKVDDISVIVAQIEGPDEEQS